MTAKYASRFSSLAELTMITELVNRLYPAKDYLIFQKLLKSNHSCFTKVMHLWSQNFHTHVLLSSGRLSVIIASECNNHDDLWFDSRAKIYLLELIQYAISNESFSAESTMGLP